MDRCFHHEPVFVRALREVERLGLLCVALVLFVPVPVVGGSGRLPGIVVQQFGAADAAGSAHDPRRSQEPDEPTSVDCSFHLY